MFACVLKENLRANVVAHQWTFFYNYCTEILGKEKCKNSFVFHSKRSSLWFFLLFCFFFFVFFFVSFSFCYVWFFLLLFYRFSNGIWEHTVQPSFSKVLLWVKTVKACVLNWVRTCVSTLGTIAITEINSKQAMERLPTFLNKCSSLAWRLYHSSVLNLDMV